MIKNDKKIYNLFNIWLLISFILVFSIIVVGGLTRLTNSGLSITQWELFKGILPPLNSTTWNQYFDLYKKIPQYELLNPSMSLSEFKVIFYWEYFHRVIARFIGIFFIIPFLYFYLSKKINKNYLIICLFVSILIIIQGIVGWYMVKSGLVNDITVSHYRLSLHLFIALIIISKLFWLILNLRNKTLKKFLYFNEKNFIFLFLLFLIFSQMTIGAFVSGLDAGMIYQTWPLMGNSYFPDDFILTKLYNLVNFENHSLVQFYHRNLAYLIIIYILYLTYYIFKNELKNLYKPLILIVFVSFLQISLGIFTLTSGINIYLASAHQITGVVLVLTAINLYYCYIK